MCRTLGVPHSILTIDWAEKPATAVQEQARAERYRHLARWAKEERLSAVATGHHLDDQAETLMMRLVRGAGVQGLAGMRGVAPIPVPGSTVKLVRPLLGWRGSELERLCADAGVEALADPSNGDEKFERVRVRKAIADSPWLDPAGIARSARNLAAADAALRWAAEREWEARTTVSEAGISYRPDAPLEIRRRIVARAIATLSSEGPGGMIRGREIDQVMSALVNGGKGTLRGVLYEAGEEWRFSTAPPRKG